jgi:hypothetical protein
MKMSAPSRIFSSCRDFVFDYISRHKHPVNACLHIIGVPQVFFGIYKLLTGQTGFGAANFCCGYFFQYLGHKAQGNEVGEVTLIKNICKKLKAKDMASPQ